MLFLFSILAWLFSLVLDGKTNFSNLTGVRALVNFRRLVVHGHIFSLKGFVKVESLDVGDNLGIYQYSGPELERCSLSMKKKPLPKPFLNLICNNVSLKSDRGNS